MLPSIFLLPIVTDFWYFTSWPSTTIYTLTWQWYYIIQTNECIMLAWINLWIITSTCVFLWTSGIMKFILDFWPDITLSVLSWTYRTIYSIFYYTLTEILYKIVWQNHVEYQFIAIYHNLYDNIFNEILFQFTTIISILMLLICIPRSDMLFIIWNYLMISPNCALRSDSMNRSEFHSVIMATTVIAIVILQRKVGNIFVITWSVVLGNPWWSEWDHSWRQYLPLDTSSNKTTLRPVIIIAIKYQKNITGCDINKLKYTNFN